MPVKGIRELSKHLLEIGGSIVFDPSVPWPGGLNYVTVEEIQQLKGRISYDVSRVTVEDETFQIFGIHSDENGNHHAYYLKRVR